MLCDYNYIYYMVQKTCQSRHPCHLDSIDEFIVCLCYGHIHGIVCLNELILCTHVCLGMKNNIGEGSFQLYNTKNSIFILSVPDMVFFVMHLPRISLTMVPPYLKKILDHILSTIHQLVASKIFLASSRQKDKFMPIY